MNDKFDRVFIVESGYPHPLPARRRRMPEKELQDLIEKHPNVLPGKQMVPDSKDPPRFVLLCHEMPVGGGSLDILLADQNGVLTLVEVKLVENRQARREVIGQIMEYAANATDLWGVEHVRKEAAQYWAKETKNIDEIIKVNFGEVNVEDFWKKVGKNLEEGRIHLIIAADELRPEARRIIEYLSGEMSNARLYGLELGYYEDESSQIIVPRLVGQTQAEVAKPRTLWRKELLHERFGKLPDPDLGKRLRRVLDWAVNNGFFLPLKAQNPGFGLRGRNGKLIISLYPSYVYCFFEDERYLGGARDRDKLVAELKELRMYDSDLDPGSVVSGRELTRELTELSEDEFTKLLDIFSHFCAEAERAPSSS